MEEEEEGFITLRRAASGDVDDGDKSNSTSTIDAHSNGLSLMEDQDFVNLDDEETCGDGPNEEWMTKQLALAMDRGVFPVHCNGRRAELHLVRFGSGNRGKSLLYEDQWHTPSEFEAFCGRAQCKDWKRSIKFHSRSLLQLIDVGVLRVHAVACTCAVCWNGESEGPIRWHDAKRRVHNNKRVWQQAIRDSNANFGSSSSKNIRLETKTMPQSSALCGQLIRSPGGTVRFVQVQSTPTWTTSEKNNEPEKSGEVSLSPTRRIAPLPTSNAFFAEFAALEKNVGTIQHQLNTFQVQLKSIRQMAERYFENNKQKEAGSESLCTNCNHPATLTCAGCQRAFYCGEFCVRRDAANHRRQCAASFGIQTDNVT